MLWELFSYIPCFDFDQIKHWNFSYFRHWQPHRSERGSKVSAISDHKQLTCNPMYFSLPPPLTCPNVALCGPLEFRLELFFLHPRLFKHYTLILTLFLHSSLLTRYSMSGVGWLSATAKESLSAYLNIFGKKTFVYDQGKTCNFWLGLT